MWESEDIQEPKNLHRDRHARQATGQEEASFILAYQGMHLQEGILDILSQF